MKNIWNKLLVEDWVVVMISVPLLVLCVLAHHLPTISIPTNMLEAGAWGKIAMLFVIALIALYAGNKLLSRTMKGMLRSFIVVFANDEPQQSAFLRLCSGSSNSPMASITARGWSYMPLPRPNSQGSWYVKRCSAE